MSTALTLLKQYFGYSQFRPQQQEIIESVLLNKDVLVLMPTGGGKSVCFQIPALLKPGMALVISPLISLMKDQVEALAANGISAGFINSSMSPSEEAEMIGKCQNEQVKLLYLSPEKALSLSGNFLKQLPISMIAIDEAHCISQWGHDFRPEYAQLKNLRKQLNAIPIIALTATADKVTRRDIVNQLELIEPELFVSSFDRPNFHLSVRSQLKAAQKQDEILAFIQAHDQQCGIVYCLSRKSTESICNFLRNQGIPADHYHAGMTSAERSKVQEDFIYDKTKVICATIAFGMGIDKSNVRWIIHYNLPKNMEGYYQEIGRAGRDGAPAKTILYYNISDLMMLNKFAAESGQAELNLEKLKRMQQYAEARVCRRKILLSYFGENYNHNCNSCDICDNPPNYVDKTQLAQKAISALLRAKEAIGIRMLIDILRGSMNADLVAAGYNKIKTHGAGREYSYDVWQSYILQLLQTGVFEMAYDEGFVLKVSDYGKRIVSGEASIELAEELAKPKRSFAKKESSSSSGETDLFSELRLLRKQIAEREALPPYLIFHDSSLLEMVDQKPVSREQMINISGVSYTKYLKYGHLFEKLIRQKLALSQVELESDFNEYLSDVKIANYIEELSKYPVRISHTTIGNLLLATKQDSYPETLRNISFYGLLKNQANYKMIGPKLQSYFKNNQVETGTPSEIEAANYFSFPIKNELTADQIQSYKDTVAGFDNSRPSDSIDNEYILKQRKEFPRAYEFWSEEENDILLELCSKTNDIKLLESILQRNETNIKSQFKKLKK